MIRHISIQQADFDFGAESARLEAMEGGAVSTFVGIVRADQPDAFALELETRLPLAEAALAELVDQAANRWPLLGVTLIHRFGQLPVGERIVFVGVATRHRRAALEATAFLIDWTKTKAPFWKKEIDQTGRGRWVEAKGEDEAAADRWLLTPAAQATSGS